MTTDERLQALEQLVEDLDRRQTDESRERMRADVEILDSNRRVA